MAVTLEQVRAALDVDEPNYDQAAKLGPDALPHLGTLVRGPDAMLASKAAYLAGLIAGGGDRAADVVATAAASGDVRVRLAAASAAKHLAAARGSEVVESLLADADPGVRKLALQSMPASVSPELRQRLQTMRFNDPEAALRTMARDALRAAPQP
jgi:hypothetical protein